MWEVLVLIDEVVAVSIPVVGARATAASKAIKMCIDRGYKTVVLLAVKNTMIKATF